MADPELHPYTGDTEKSASNVKPKPETDRTLNALPAHTHMFGRAQPRRPLEVAEHSGPVVGDP